MSLAHLLAPAASTLSPVIPPHTAGLVTPPRGDSRGLSSLPGSCPFSTPLACGPKAHEGQQPAGWVVALGLPPLPPRQGEWLRGGGEHSPGPEQSLAFQGSVPVTPELRLSKRERLAPTWAPRLSDCLSTDTHLPACPRPALCPQCTVCCECQRPGAKCSASYSRGRVWRQGCSAAASEGPAM